MKWGPFGSNRPSGSRPAMERFVAGSVESVDVMTSEVASVASEYTRRAVELESGFVEAMESQGYAPELEECSRHVASVLQTASCVFGRLVSTALWGRTSIELAS